jgi:hypothetical protein
MSKHTPGPWFHKTDFGQVGSVETADGDVIAQAQSLGPLDHERRNANARLIAAAPDLLAALKLVLEDAREFFPTVSAQAITAAEAAIAKAEGER